MLSFSITSKQFNYFDNLAKEVNKGVILCVDLFIYLFIYVIHEYHKMDKERHSHE